MSNILPPPISDRGLSENALPITKRRDSNLELYRIIVMLLIVMHHYVVNSGLLESLRAAEFSASSMGMMLFGAWGKTGINCFVLITGYFMCRSNFSWQKMLKLYLQIIFWGIVIYITFCAVGRQIFSPYSFLRQLFPVTSVSDGFTSCFLIFYLCIPFLNVLIQHLDKQMHLLLLILLVTVYSMLPSLTLRVTFNYVTWFGVLYVVASYIRFYSSEWRITHRQWGWLALLSFAAGLLSVAGVVYLRQRGILHNLPEYFFVSDSNKFLSLLIAVTSFMWFKGVKMPYIPFVNVVGATTFGVLLIHADSDQMRQWLWKETVDCTGHFSEALLPTLGYAFLCVVTIFIVCSALDWARGKYVEPWMMKLPELMKRKKAVQTD